MTYERCEVDRERRQRAINDGALIVRDGPMERRLVLEAGYDHTAFGCGHGRHGMALRFILIGPNGAVHWLAYANNWFPGNLDSIDNVRPALPSSLMSYVPSERSISDATPADLGYHAPTPMFEGQDASDCDLLAGGSCFYDGSGLAAGPVLAAFLEYGPMAVWATLARYYVATFGDDGGPDIGTDR